MNKINFNPVAHDQTFYGPAFGWHWDERASEQTLAAMEEYYGQEPLAATMAPDIVGATATDEPVFFWQAEEKVLGKRLLTWNQLQVGSCVGFGNGRSSQDLMLWEIAAGVDEPEEYPGSEVAPEVIYGGSRVEIGGGRLRGDGSLGAWAAKYLMQYGVVIRGRYDGLDLTKYDEQTCRQLGSQGLPPNLETLARQHPVKAAALVQSGDELWNMIGAGKPVAVCSDRGFAMRRNPDGTCTPSGTWQHCMAHRGRYTTPQGKKRIVIANSWGDYLGSDSNSIEYRTADGQTAKMELPPGHFGVDLEVADGMVSQGDSFALAGLSGWKATRINYNPLR